MPAPPKPSTDDTAIAYVQTYCGWHIAPSVTETLTLDGPGGNVLVLPSLYVTDVSAITEDGTVLADGTDPDVPADYTWSQAGIVRRSWATGIWSGWCGVWWTSQLRGIQVDLTHGYDTWPLDLAAVIGTISERVKDNPSNLEQITVGPFSEKYATGGASISDGDLMVLNKYRLPWRLY
jgi:hypothetical protein